MTSRSLFLIPSNLGPLDLIRYLVYGMEGLDDSVKIRSETDGMAGNIEVDIWMVVGWISSLAMVVGSVMPYVPQYLEIRKTKNADGFSLYVCLTLLVANILRILFWFGSHYEIPLFVQSIIMNLAMLAIVQLCVQMKQAKEIIHGKDKLFTDCSEIPSTNTSLWDFDSRFFWKWTDFRSYVEFIAAFTAGASILTYFFIKYTLYVEILGFTSLLIEACLGLPQFYDNYQSKSTFGMSRAMVGLWLVGDTFKTIYFISRRSPIQFSVCGALQIGVDLAILSQTVWYGTTTPGRRKGSHVVQ